MVFGGIDLAADPRRTGVAQISNGTPTVVEMLVVGAEDADIAAIIMGSDMSGIDVPLGWPDAFVALLADHAAHALAPPPSTGSDWRRTMAMRTTDVMVHQRTGRVPLSVSTDRIAYPALRWAGIEARLRAEGIDVPRDGSGRICEVYPAAALSCWGLPSRGYKRREQSGQRTEIIDRLSYLFPDLDWNGHRNLCIDDDNALDAVVSALMARLVADRQADPPPEAMRDVVSREGWIWLPQQNNGCSDER